jgi:mannose-6-phosphate isomerase-like protein (cupin superfamily)
MYVRTADEDGLTRKNNCDLRLLYPWEDVVVPPWNSTLCSIRPLESSKEHAHATDETFIFTGGSGMVRVGGEHRTIGPGDVIYIPHDTTHIVTNTSDADPLTFVSIYWLQDPKARAEADG